MGGSLESPDQCWIVIVHRGILVWVEKDAKKGAPGQRLTDLTSNLDRAYLLRWPVLLGIGLPSFLFVLLRAQQDNTPGGYWIAGLAVQFTPLLLTLSFATICIKMRGQHFFPIFLGFSLLLIASGSRFDVLATALLAISAMVRYSVRLPKLTLFVAALTLVGAAAAITASRGTYGRFNAGESFLYAS